MEKGGCQELGGGWSSDGWPLSPGPSENNGPFVRSWPPAFLFVKGNAVTPSVGRCPLCSDRTLSTKVTGLESYPKELEDTAEMDRPGHSLLAASWERWITSKNYSCIPQYPWGVTSKQAQVHDGQLKVDFGFPDYSREWAGLAVSCPLTEPGCCASQLPGLVG